MLSKKVQLSDSIECTKSGKMYSCIAWVDGDDHHAGEFTEVRAGKLSVSADHFLLSSKVDESVRCVQPGNEPILECNFEE